MCIGVRLGGIHAERGVMGGIFLIKLCEDQVGWFESCFVIDRQKIEDYIARGRTLRI